MPLRFSSALLCISLVGVAARGQQPRDPAVAEGAIAAGSMSGRIVVDDGAGTSTSLSAGRPVRHASVHVQRLDTGLKADVPERIAITDDDGMFGFQGVPAGRYMVWATKSAWVSAWYGSKRPGDSTGAMSIVIVGSQSIKNMTLKMVKGAAITGTLTDASGQPLPGAQASVMQSKIDFQRGLRTFVSVGAPELGVADNRGVYRIYGLAPGTYMVMVEVPNGPFTFRKPGAAEWQWTDAAAASTTEAVAWPDATQSRTYAPVYHPGTSVRADAALVTVRAGEERSAIDIRVEPVPVSTVNVQVATGPEVSDMTFFALRNGDDGFRFGGRPDAGGRFTIRNMTPGTYTIVAQPGPRTTGRLWAMTEVSVVDSDVSAVLSLQPPLEVSGKVTFVSTGLAPPDLTRVRVSLTPASSNPANPLFNPAAADATGAFSVTNVIPGKYRFAASITGAGTNSGWTLSSATVRGRDTLDLPLDIKPGEPIEATLVFTDRTTSLSGTLVDATGRPAPDYFVIAFPVDQSFWMPGSRRIAASRPGVDGRYVFPNLPAGDYLIGAVTDVEPFQWFDEAFLSELKGAALPVTLVDGKPTTHNLRLGGKQAERVVRRRPHFLFFTVTVTGAEVVVAPWLSAAMAVST
jgi:hypothetical protein